MIPSLPHICNPCDPCASTFGPQTWELHCQFHPGPIGYQMFIPVAGVKRRLFSKHSITYLLKPSTTTNAERIVNSFTGEGGSRDPNGIPPIGATIAATTWDLEDAFVHYSGELHNEVIGSPDLVTEAVRVAGLLSFPSSYSPTLPPTTNNYEATFQWIANPFGRNGAPTPNGMTAEHWFHVAPQDTSLPNTFGHYPMFPEIYGFYAVSQGKTVYHQIYPADVLSFYFEAEEIPGNERTVEATKYFWQSVTLMDGRYTNHTTVPVYAHLYSTPGGSRQETHMGWNSTNTQWIIRTPGTYASTVVIPPLSRYLARMRTPGYVRISSSATPP